MGLGTIARVDAFSRQTRGGTPTSQTALERECVRLRALLWIAMLGLSIAPRAAAAHDFWIEPATHWPVVGAPFKVALRIGDPFQGKPYPRVPERIVRFVLVPAVTDQAGELPVQGASGWEPAGIARAEHPGLHSVVYMSTPARIELPAAEFDAYLREKGLDAALAARASLGHPPRPGRERYVRCAKSMVVIQPPHVRPTQASASRSVAAPAVGLPLELVLDAHPDALRVSQQLPVRVLFRGRALAGALIIATAADSPKTSRSLRSDAQGRVRFPIEHPGVWLVTVSHMLPLESDTAADWQSYWGSLTFEIQGSSDLED